MTYNDGIQESSEKFALSHQLQSPPTTRVTSPLIQKQSKLIVECQQKWIIELRLLLVYFDSSLMFEKKISVGNIPLCYENDIHLDIKDFIVNP